MDNKALCGADMHNNSRYWHIKSYTSLTVNSLGVASGNTHPLCFQSCRAKLALTTDRQELLGLVQAVVVNSPNANELSSFKDAS